MFTEVLPTKALLTVGNLIPTATTTTTAAVEEEEEEEEEDMCENTTAVDGMTETMKIAW